MPGNQDLRETLLQHVYSAIDEVNQQLPPAGRIAKSPATVLTGSDGALESLSFLNLIVAAEDRVNAGFATSINLASMLMESEDSPPPRDVGELVDLIATRLREAGHG